MVAEVNDAHRRDELVAWYTALVAACATRTALSSVIAGEAGAEFEAGVAATAPGDDGAFYYSPGPAEQVHELAVAADAYISVGAMSWTEVEAFFRRRVTALTEQPATLDGAAAREALDDLLPQLDFDGARTLLWELRALGVISDAEASERRRPSALLENAFVDPSEVGAIVARWAGPDRRIAGVRVIAVEAAERGVLLHLHLGPDGGPELRLADGRGDRYRGCVPGRPARDPDELPADGVEVAAFKPAMTEAGELWLEAVDGEERLRVR